MELQAGKRRSQCMELEEIVKQLLMGNEAIAKGAIQAGVNVVAGYPGTPSTEVLETVAKQNKGNIYIEWSVNEKAALEVAAGAAYAGARTMVTMKQVGLNVASDPLMCLAYMGVKGGMVVVVADDPGPISSQTEQDTRTFAAYSKLPVFDPASPEEAYEMIQAAFLYSEQYQTPVLFRPTTRVCHACAVIDVPDTAPEHSWDGFVKDPGRWVIFPRLSRENHIKIENRNRQIAMDKTNIWNTIQGSGRLGIAVGGVSVSYVKEALQNLQSSLAEQGQPETDLMTQVRLLQVGMPHPFPEALAVEFLEEVDTVLVAEELDPVIERNLIYVCGKYQKSVRILGKESGHLPYAGEYTNELLQSALASYLQIETEEVTPSAPPKLPVRPPVLCAGCPHRASFYAVKQAMKGKRAVFCGDIGCYTLGNAKPLDMVDTCLCMGADVTIAQGLKRTEPGVTAFSFIGDSTFFASGITGVVNAVYNQTDIILIVLDNSTTAMTGHQPHPGTGMTMMGEVVEKVSIEKILTAIGVTSVETVNPLDLEAAVTAVQKAAVLDGVKAIIFKSPCIALVRPDAGCRIDREACINCKKCIRELGCPAIVVRDGQVEIEASMCTGCGLCSQICPVGAIKGGQHA